MNKKGQGLSGLQPSVMIIILTGLIISLGIIILDQLATNVDVQGQSTIRIDNETQTALAAGDRVTYVDRGVTFIMFMNASNSSGDLSGHLSANYNITSNFTTNSYGEFVLSGTGSERFEGIAVNVTYTYQQSGVAYRGVNSTRGAIENVTAWLPIIVLVIVAGLILGLLVRNFVGRRQA